MLTEKHRPVLIVIAGPNGSGKTTITSKILRHEWLEDALYVNPDWLLLYEKDTEIRIISLYRTGTHADNLSFVVGDNARLTIIVDAAWDTGAVHLSGQHVLLGRDATLRYNAATFGGDVVRMVPRVKFTGPGADAGDFSHPGRLRSAARRVQRHCRLDLLRGHQDQLPRRPLRERQSLHRRLLLPLP